MADARTLQKRARGRPRKVVADAEAPAIDSIVDTIPTKDVKPAPANAKKPRAKREATTKADAAIEKTIRTTVTTTKKTNGSPPANQKPATTKHLADPPAAAAASITPPNPTPQASPSTTTARPPRPKAAAEPAPDKSAAPTTAIAIEAKNSTAARAETTTAADSKILSELAARELLLPLQSGKDDNGAGGNEEKTTVGAEDTGRVLETSHLELLRDTQADGATTKVAGELHRQEKELARIGSTSVANPTASTPSGGSGSGSGSSNSIETKNSTPAHLQPPPSSTTASTTLPLTEAAHTIPSPMARPQQQPPQGQVQGQVQGQQPPAPNKPPRPLPYSPHRPSKDQAPAAAAAPPAEEQPPRQQPHQRQQRPPPHQWKPVEPLPAAYKPAARRWTLAIVAMPVALVTSYALYDRLVLGNERKEIRRVVNPDLSNAVKEVDAEKTEKGL